MNTGYIRVTSWSRTSIDYYKLGEWNLGWCKTCIINREGMSRRAWRGVYGRTSKTQTCAPGWHLLSSTFGGTEAILIKGCRLLSSGNPVWIIWEQGDQENRNPERSDRRRSDVDVRDVDELPSADGDDVLWVPLTSEYQFSVWLHNSVIIFI